MIKISDATPSYFVHPLATVVVVVILELSSLLLSSTLAAIKCEKNVSEENLGVLLLTYAANFTASKWHTSTYKFTEVSVSLIII